MGLSFPTGTTYFDCATSANTLDNIKRLLQRAPGGEPIDSRSTVDARDAMQELLFRARDWIGLRMCGEEGVTKLMLEVQFSRLNDAIRTMLDPDLTSETLTSQACAAASLLRTLSRGD